MNYITIADKKIHVIYMSNCTKFSDLAENEVSALGQKAAGLTALFNSGYPIPPGFVVSASLFDSFLAQTGLKEKVWDILAHATPDDYPAVSQISKQLRDAILSSEFPQVLEDEILECYRKFNLSEDMQKLNDVAKSIIDAGRSDVYVSVRASPIATQEQTSFSGMQDTSYYVHGTVGVIKAIQKCMASYFSFRSIIYRLKNNIPHNGLMTIIIQEMILSEKSGVIATANPANASRTQTVIEGLWGVGEGVTGGGITPDKYIIDKETGHIIDKKISIKDWQYSIDPMNGGLQKDQIPETKKEERVLSVNELKVLFSLSEKIHNHFRRPQMIEWAIYKNRVYILQSTPLFIPQQDIMQEPPTEMQGTPIAGFGNFAKTKTGNVTFIYNDVDFSKLSGTDVIVSGYATTDLVPALLKSSAIVTDEGGTLSNMATIAREFGIPMVCGTKQATRKIPEGVTVTVNAKEGLVFESRPPAPPMQNPVYPPQYPQETQPQNTQFSPQTQGMPQQPEQNIPVQTAQNYPPQSNPQQFPQPTAYPNTQQNPQEVPREPQPPQNTQQPDPAQNEMPAKPGSTPSEPAQTAIKVKYNISDLTELNSIQEKHDGIGFIDLKAFYSRNTAAQTETQEPMPSINGFTPSTNSNEPTMTINSNAVAELIEKFYPKEVWLKISAVGEETIQNDFSCLVDVSARGYTNIGVVVPLIDHPAKIQALRTMAQQSGLDLSRLKLGVLIDSPTQVFVLEELVKEGINFAVLDAEKLAKSFASEPQPNHAATTHPAFMAAMRQAISVLNKSKVSTTIKGFSEDMPFVDKMISFGVESFTVAVHTAQTALLSIERAEKAKMINLMKERHQMQF